MQLAHTHSHQIVELIQCCSWLCYCMSCFPSQVILKLHCLKCHAMQPQLAEFPSHELGVRSHGGCPAQVTLLSLANFGWIKKTSKKQKKCVAYALKSLILPNWTKSRFSPCDWQSSWWCAGQTSPSWRRAPPSCCPTPSKWAPASTSTSSQSSSTSTRPSSWPSSWPTSPCVSCWTTRVSNRTAHCPSSRRSRPRRCQR